MPRCRHVLEQVDDLSEYVTSSSFWLIVGLVIIVLFALYECIIRIKEDFDIHHSTNNYEFNELNSKVSDNRSNIDMLSGKLKLSEMNASALSARLSKLEKMCAEKCAEKCQEQCTKETAKVVEKIESEESESEEESEGSEEE